MHGNIVFQNNGHTHKILYVDSIHATEKAHKTFWEYSDLCLLHYVELPVASIIHTRTLHCSLFTVARCMMANSYNRVQSKQVDFHHLSDITAYNADRKEEKKGEVWMGRVKRERER